MLWQCCRMVFRGVQSVYQRNCACVSVIKDIQTWSKHRFVINSFQIDSFSLCSYFWQNVNRSRTNNTGSYIKNATSLNFCNYVSSTESRFWWLYLPARFFMIVDVPVEIRTRYLPPEFKPEALEREPICSVLYRSEYVLEQIWRCRYLHCNLTQQFHWHTLLAHCVGS